MKGNVQKTVSISFQWLLSGICRLKKGGLLSLIDYKLSTNDYLLSTK
jgi:hypothetical protein